MTDSALHGQAVPVSGAATNSTTVDLICPAEAIFSEDVALCDAIAGHGESLIQDGDGILTHCNTGGLATAGIGTGSHIAGEYFFRFIVKANAKHVPFRGGPDATNAVLGGHVPTSDFGIRAPVGQAVSQPRQPRH